MSKLPPPPVPRKLCELLKDYPQQIARLQDVLAAFAAHPAPRLQPFDEAIWSLEEELAEFIAKAQDELEAAQASGDPAAIEQATEKERAMLRARPKVRWLSHDGFWNYFEEHREAFE